jgi:hypothetical protein
MDVDRRKNYSNRWADSRDAKQQQGRLQQQERQKRWKLQYQKGRHSDRDSGSSIDSTPSRDSKDVNNSKNSSSSRDASSSTDHENSWKERQQQGVTKRCRLSWLTNSALVYEPKCGGRGEGVAGA